MELESKQREKENFWTEVHSWHDTRATIDDMKSLLHFHLMQRWFNYSSKGEINKRTMAVLPSMFVLEVAGYWYS
jgi:hypothetical protein